MIGLTWKLFRPLLFSMDAEKAHRFVMERMENNPVFFRSMLSMGVKRPANHLKTQLASLELSSPIGLAAGMDKDGEALPGWPSLGFGFVELGTVTAHAQQGNPKPRLFRLVEEEGIINRMGFNNQGSEALAKKLASYKDKGLWPNIPVGANVGKSKITPLEEAGEDYRISISRLQGLVDYFTVNVSSPNTPGLRELQSADNLKILLDQAMPAAKETPVFVKFAPDMNPTDLEQAIDVVISMGGSGIIGTNTTNTRPNTTGRLNETGGLSGLPLWPLAKDQIQFILDQVDKRVPVIGVGGVNNADKAQHLLDIGCTAIQIYSALIFKGPTLISEINNGLRKAEVAP